MAVKNIKPQHANLSLKHEYQTLIYVDFCLRAE